MNAMATISSTIASVPLMLCVKYSTAIASAMRMRMARSAVPMFLVIGAFLAKRVAATSRLPQMQHQQGQARKHRETKETRGCQFRDGGGSNRHRVSRLKRIDSFGHHISGKTVI